MTFDNIALKSATRIVTVTKIVADDLVLHQGVNRSKIVTIYNGVDLERFSEISPQKKMGIRSTLGIDSKKKVVGMVAQLTDWKGIPYFLKAIPLILKECRDVMFVIVGDGKERKNLETMAQALGISSYVVFTGFRRDIPEMMSVMDVLVLSSLREGLPNVLIEAMAMRKPVVATNVGGVPELVIDNETGFLIPPRNPDALAKAILNFLVSRAKARKFGEKGRIYAEQKFSLTQMVKNYENLYSQIAAESSRH
jgi:glycosyltransferase involved in cell wall biosynthesis